MPLDKQTIKRLKSQSHDLKPVIIIGQKGLTPEVQDETDRALNDHELIKIRINASDKTERQIITDAIVDVQGCEFVHSIGHVIIVYRPKLAD